MKFFVPFARIKNACKYISGMTQRKIAGEKSKYKISSCYLNLNSGMYVMSRNSRHISNKFSALLLQTPTN